VAGSLLYPFNASDWLVPVPRTFTSLPIAAVQEDSSEDSFIEDR